jgi:hypothetical protein
MLRRRELRSGHPETAPGQTSSDGCIGGSPSPSTTGTAAPTGYQAFCRSAPSPGIEPVVKWSPSLTGRVTSPPTWRSTRASRPVSPSARMHRHSSLRVLLSGRSASTLHDRPSTSRAAIPIGMSTGSRAPHRRLSSSTRQPSARSGGCSRRKAVCQGCPASGGPQVGREAPGPHGAFGRG